MSNYIPTEQDRVAAAFEWDQRLYNFEAQGFKISIDDYKVNGAIVTCPDETDLWVVTRDEIKELKICGEDHNRIKIGRRYWYFILS